MTWHMVWLDLADPTKIERADVSGSTRLSDGPTVGGEARGPCAFSDIWRTNFYRNSGEGGIGARGLLCIFGLACFGNF